MGWVRFPYNLMYACMSQINYLCVKVGNCCMYNKWMKLHGNFTNNGIYLVSLGPFHWRLFSKKAALPRLVRRTVEFAGILLLIRRSREHRDVCWSLIGRKNIFCAQSDASIRISPGTGLFKGSIPGSLSSVLESSRRRFSRPNWPPLGLRGWNASSLLFLAC